MIRKKKTKSRQVNKKQSQQEKILDEYLKCFDPAIVAKKFKISEERIKSFVNSPASLRIIEERKTQRFKNLTKDEMDNWELSQKLLNKILKNQLKKTTINHATSNILGIALKNHKAFIERQEKEASNIIDTEFVEKIEKEIKELNEN